MKYVTGLFSALRFKIHEHELHVDKFRQNQEKSNTYGLQSGQSEGNFTQYGYLGKQ